MNCPKCNSSMNLLPHLPYSAQKCSNCHGLWFKGGEKDVVAALKDAECLDSPETNIAANYNSQRDIDCPACQTKMIKMADKSQLHIKFESCPSCRGIFFDAGELTDLSEHTLVEKLKQAAKNLKRNLNR